MASSAFRGQGAGLGLRSSSADFWNAHAYGRNTVSARRPVFGRSYLPSEFGAKVSVRISAFPSSLLLLRGQFRNTVRNPNQQTIAETYLPRQGRLAEFVSGVRTPRSTKNFADGDTASASRRRNMRNLPDKLYRRAFGFAPTEGSKKTPETERRK